MSMIEAAEKWALHASQWRIEWVLAALIVLALLGVLAVQKIITIILTLRAQALAPALSRRISSLVKSLDYSDREFLSADGAGERWIQVRREAIDRLAGFFQTQCAKSIAWGDNIRNSF